MEKMYEAVIFIKPTLSEEELNAVVAKCRAYILENKGIIAEEKAPEKKRIAYEVKKFRDAYYYFIKFSMDPSLVNEFGKKLRVVEEVLRQSIVLYEAPKIKPKKERKKPVVEAAARVETAPAPPAAPAVPAAPAAPAAPVVDTKDQGI
jgi:small subunit ribosomal protein S6